MVGMFDRDNSRTINVHEFCDLWKYLGQWRKTFDQFDQDRSGNISKQKTVRTRLSLKSQNSIYIEIIYNYIEIKRSGNHVATCCFIRKCGQKF